MLLRRAVASIRHNVVPFFRTCGPASRRFSQNGGGGGVDAWDKWAPRVKDVLLVLFPVVGLLREYHKGAQDDQDDQDDRQFKARHLEREELERKDPTHQDICKHAQDHFARELEEQNKNPISDYYKPFITNDALTDALRSTLSNEVFKPGVIVVAAPKGAGKTTRIRQVCYDLAKAGKVRGAVYVNFATKANVFAHFWHSVAGISDPKHTVNSIFAVIPPHKGSSSKMVVLILDNVDDVNQEDLRGLCNELMIASASMPDVAKFLVVVTCSMPDVAAGLLQLNGGEKVRALGFGATLVYGDKNAPVGSWVHRGLKWSGVDCEALVSEFEKDRFKGKKLADDVRKKLLELAVEAGTPSLIRDFFEDAGSRNIVHSSGTLRAELNGKFTAQAQDSAHGWRQVASIEDPRQVANRQRAQARAALQDDQTTRRPRADEPR